MNDADKFALLGINEHETCDEFCTITGETECI